MIYEQEFPRTTGFYWCKPSLLVNPELVFIRQNMTEEEVIKVLPEEYHNADYGWSRHHPSPVTDEAATYLLANQDTWIKMLEWDIKENRAYFVEVEHRDGRFKTFGNQA